MNPTPASPTPSPALAVPAASAAPKATPGHPTGQTASKTAPETPKVQMVNPVNPAWAHEVATAHGLTGPKAKAVAEAIAAEVSAAILKRFPKPKLAKMASKAFAKATQAAQTTRAA